MARPSSVPVAVLVQQTGYGRQVLTGVVNYVRQGAPWHFFPIDSARLEAPPAGIDSMHPRGVIAQLSSPASLEWARGFPGKIVNISGVRDTPYPTVGMDNTAIGAMAGRHLVERGYKHFACVTHDVLAYAVRREAGFGEAVRGVACSYRVLNRALQPAPVSFDERDAEARQWFGSLPKPCGVFLACAPRWSVMAVSFSGVRSPQDVGIVDVGDDILVSEMHTPPLTTVDYPGDQIGFEAARLLDQLMRGARPPAKPILLPPTRVTVRGSTDFLASADPAVVAALRHIRANLEQPLSVADVAAACAVSRRTLERRLQHLGLSLVDEIRQARCEQACKLLAETDMPLKQVAARSGLGSVHRLCRIIRQSRNVTPLQYRIQAGQQPS